MISTPLPESHLWSSQYCLTTQETFRTQYHSPNSYEYPRKAGLKTVIEQKGLFLSRAHWWWSFGAPPLDSGGLGLGELVT